MPSPAIYPDLLIIAPTGAELTVVAYRTGWRDAAELWPEVLPLADWDELPQRLTAVLTRRATRSKTPVALVTPAGVGGFILYPRAEGEKCDGPWVQRQIELTLPYPAAEIAYRVHCVDNVAQLFWVPNDWIKAQQVALEKLGLVLDEILPRACLFQDAQVGKSSGASQALIEGKPEQAYLYLQEQGVISQAIQLPAAANDADLHAMAGGMLAAGLQPQTVALDSGQLGGRLLGLWQDEACALRVAGNSWQLWKPGILLALAVTALALLLPAFFYGSTLSMQERLGVAQKELRGLAKQVDQFQDDQRAVAKEDGLVRAVREIDAAPMPLDLLAKIVEALPDKAWIQNLTYTGKTLVIAGKGVSDGELSKRLQQSGLVVSEMRVEPAGETNDFRLRIQGAPETPNKQEVGK